MGCFCIQKTKIPIAWVSAVGFRKFLLVMALILPCLLRFHISVFTARYWVSRATKNRSARLRSVLGFCYVLWLPKCARNEKKISATRTRLPSTRTAPLFAIEYTVFQGKLLRDRNLRIDFDPEFWISAALNPQMRPVSSQNLPIPLKAWKEVSNHTLRLSEF